VSNRTASGRGAWQGFWASLQLGRPLASAFASTRGRAHEQTAAPSHAGPMARGLMADGTRARRPQAQQLPKQRAYSVHTTNKWRHR
jgi:hypothetical protein